MLHGLVHFTETQSSERQFLTLRLVYWAFDQGDANLAHLRISLMDNRRCLLFALDSLFNKNPERLQGKTITR